MIVCYLQMSDPMLAIKLGMIGPLANAQARATFNTKMDAIGVLVCDECDLVIYFFAWPLVADQTQDEQAGGASRRPT